jgi:3-deoxy-D-manno-octulosonate 8-phosphate phosphatase KdsC-like HAD superfamily phosphatase
VNAQQIYLDCDGVLTDGTLTIDHRGEKLFKRFHTRDVRAIRELVARGYTVTLVSADDWAGLPLFAEKVGADVLILRDKGSLPQPYIAVGDDAWDVSMLARAERAFCPIDADVSVLEIPKITTLSTKGGAGVVAELVRALVGADG